MELDHHLIALPRYLQSYVYIEENYTLRVQRRRGASKLSLRSAVDRQRGQRDLPSPPAPQPHVSTPNVRAPSTHIVRVRVHIIRNARI